MTAAVQLSFPPTSLINESDLRMIEMLKLVRDIVITIAMAQLIVGYWLVRNPEFVGHWLADVDIAYDSAIWTNYAADCDCTENYAE